jgi:uncharacterized protein (DUF1501 family)
MKGRSFLKNSGLISTTALIPGFLSAFQLQNSLDFKGKRLLILQLSGGNDGLNTIVPFRNDIYYKLRPTIALKENQLIKISDDVALNASMKNMANLFDQGEVLFINNVGYPNPDRSHFRSMDIWQSGSGSNEFWNTGWIGRSLDAACPGSEYEHYAIEVDDSLSLALKGEFKSGFAVSDPLKLHRVMKDEQLEYILNQGKTEGDDHLSFLYKTLANTKSSAEYICEKSKRKQSVRNYSQNALGKHLKMTAELINAGIDTKVFYASISGFDTHIRQVENHQRLLNIVSESLFSFRCDLKESGEWNNTVVMVFSEFGRRAKQNASNGTDHGTANNVWILGGNLKQKGFYNSLSKLSELDQNDLIFELDFRRIYADMIEKILEIPHEKILRRQFEPLNII